MLDLYFNTKLRASQVALVLKNSPTSAGDVRDTISILGSGRSSGGGWATHSSIAAWRIPWSEESSETQHMEPQGDRTEGS